MMHRNASTHVYTTIDVIVSTRVSSLVDKF